MENKRITTQPTRLVTAMGGSLLLAAGLLAGCGGEEGPKSAQKTPLGVEQANGAGSDYMVIKDGEIVARINGSPLYKENLLVVKENLGAEVPEDRLVSRMVELRLLADKAREQGLEDEPRTRARVQNAIDNQLANAYLTRYVAEVEISEEDLREAYEEVEAEYAENIQHRARHILVESEELARDILAQLDDGGAFEELAGEHSTDPGSAEEGGDLGWFNLDQMVAPFAEMVESLEPGQTAAEPVETRFGWHVVRLDDTRPTPAPSFDDLRPELEEHVRRQAVNDMISELRADANVEILTSDVRSLVDRDEDGVADEADGTGEANGTG
ncbi:peptidylprolyl isomerase, partial [Guyparkeria sp.]|uniref:peptidylprolyl isomerase n=1 Tax=Guyparkeria sp. TaxID=2035736 RepID=UPI003561E143